MDSEKIKDLLETVHDLVDKEAHDLMADEEYEDANILLDWLVSLSMVITGFDQLPAKLK